MSNQSDRNSREVGLITGSSTSFGRQLSETLARKGHIIFAAMRYLFGKNAEYASALRELAIQENLSLEVVEMETPLGQRPSRTIPGSTHQPDERSSLQRTLESNQLDSIGCF
ncbi:MAG: hypothetical protein H7Y37_21075 [Anaerolineae bacterium]|nr:hypothetical protein [Gloeobacterales cyanobacterium ES-bin-313]